MPPASNWIRSQLPFNSRISFLTPFQNFKVQGLKMGALTDITAKANNTAKRSPNTPITSASQARGSPQRDENLTKGRSPRFMSPTLSSTQQAATKLSKAQDRNTTPSSIVSNKAQGNNWMASAAKRVGFRRGGDGTPHARKAGITSKAIGFPDKVHASFSLTTSSPLTMN